VNWLHFFWTLVAGCVPVAALYAFAGSQLRGVHTLRDVSPLMWPRFSAAGRRSCRSSAVAAAGAATQPLTANALP
jgi:uncharacterized membrane protein YdjX (TVP38/TMEM64 family)